MPSPVPTIDMPDPYYHSALEGFTVSCMDQANSFFRTRSLFDARARGLRDQYQHLKRSGRLAFLQVDYDRLNADLAKLCKARNRLDIDYITNSPLSTRLEARLRLFRRYFRKHFPKDMKTHSLEIFDSFRERANTQSDGVKSFQDLLVDRQLTNMTDVSHELRVGCYKHDMVREIETSTAEGSYVVFDTLTVADWHLDAVFSKGSKAFINYINTIRVKIWQSGQVPYYCKYQKRYKFPKPPPGALDKIHSYFTAVERGSQATHRWHIHVIHCMARLPYGWDADPNSGLPDPYRLEIDAMKKLWNYGWSTPIACRFGSGDPFSRLGWRWPSRRHKTHDDVFIPQSRGAPSALACYVSKYVTKSYSQEGDIPWKVRRSRNYGMKLLRMALFNLEIPELMGLMALQSSRRCLWRQTQIPLRTVHNQAAKELLTRCLPPVLRKLLLALLPRPSLPEQLRSPLNEKTIRNAFQATTKIGDTPTLAISDTVAFSPLRAADRLTEELDKLTIPLMGEPSPAKVGSPGTSKGTLSNV